MKQLQIILLLLAFGCVKSNNQDISDSKEVESEPIRLVRKIFTDESFIKDIASYSIGEYKGRPNKYDLEEGALLTFKSLEETDSTAVINMTVNDTSGKSLDTYLFLVNERGWKVKAFRALAMTGMLEELLLEFEKMNEKDIEEFIQSEEDIQTKEDFYYEMNNIKLILKLLIRDLNDYKIFCADCLGFTVGGMIDNTVGYFYLEDKNKLPKMNTSRIIMIRKIGDGWYLYKTT